MVDTHVNFIPSLEEPNVEHVKHRIDECTDCASDAPKKYNTVSETNVCHKTLSPDTTCKVKECGTKPIPGINNADVDPGKSEHRS